MKVYKKKTVHPYCVYLTKEEADLVVRHDYLTLLKMKVKLAGFVGSQEETE